MEDLYSVDHFSTEDLMLSKKKKNTFVSAPHGLFVLSMLMIYKKNILVVILLQKIFLFKNFPTKNQIWFICCQDGIRRVKFFGFLLFWTRFIN